MFTPTIAFHPWEYIGDELEARNWSQAEFAKLIWTSRQFLNDLIKGRKNITPRLAILIWAAFWTSADLWISMQEKYDIYVLEKDKSFQKKIFSVKERVEELSFA